jgi:hypothetical protein
MSSSAFFMDVSPQYRDAGCPSQCMGMNEYTTISNMYSFSTDPMTPLLAASPSSPFNTTVANGNQLASMGTTFANPRIATNYKGPGVKYTGAQMAAILQGYAMEKNAKPFDGRSPEGNM